MRLNVQPICTIPASPLRTTFGYAYGFETLSSASSFVQGEDYHPRAFEPESSITSCCVYEPESSFAIRCLFMLCNCGMS